MLNIIMKLIIIVVIVCALVKCNAISLDYYDPGSDFYVPPDNDSEEDSNQAVNTFLQPPKVQIMLFYEVFCPHCRTFFTETFSPVLAKLGRYLDIYTYPYGNAETVEKNNKIYFTCQHGPTECYGNKLHACALDIVKSNTRALKYNICMMKYSNSNQGSDDNAADKCGKSLLIDSTPIKKCAKGSRGTELLKLYGEESKKADFKHVPHILINGVKNDGKHFMRDVCAAFAEPPSECRDILRRTKLQRKMKQNWLMRTRMVPVFLICSFCVTLANSYTILTDVSFNDLLDEDLPTADVDLMHFIPDKTYTEQKLNIKLFYECHCPGCREFETTEFKKTVERLNDYLDIQTYPYGNAKTEEHDGKVEFKCQHGPKECYGNKLHACALNIIKNHTAALQFNMCMMESSQENRGSDDKAADKCGANMRIDSRPIKSCAKGAKGIELLKYYGVESTKIGFQYVPFVLINGVEYNGENFFKDVCKYFSKPPPSCMGIEN
ncbi:uncharacterized protein LOC110994806 [Pieris rapae]|uniref:uncharacterized protein LOC110994806 n=1 Tax=Pieris rapae TaxID=64459 RepID=UPI001E27F8A8|nr:uncharacterized protein LOC110994806 [Pieris rapae]